MQTISIYIKWPSLMKKKQKKSASKIEFFVGLAPGVNFINILCTLFSYISLFSSFSLVTFGFLIFGAKILYKKHVHKTLMKLTPEEIFNKLARILLVYGRKTYHAFVNKEEFENLLVKTFAEM